MNKFFLGFGGLLGAGVLISLKPGWPPSCGVGYPLPSVFNTLGALLGLFTLIYIKYICDAHTQTKHTKHKIAGLCVHFFLLGAACFLLFCLTGAAVGDPLFFYHMAADGLNSYDIDRLDQYVLSVVQWANVWTDVVLWKWFYCVDAKHKLNHFSKYISLEFILSKYLQGQYVRKSNV